MNRQGNFWINIAGFMNALNKHYLCLFFLGVYYSQPSGKLFLYAFIGLLISQLLITINIQFNSWTTLLKLFYDVINKLVGQKKENKDSVILTGYYLTEYLPHLDLKVLFNHYFVNPAHNLFHSSPNESVLVFTIKNNIPIAAKKKIHTTLTTFSRPLSTSYIFINDSPYEQTLGSKLVAYHEIGHALVSTLFLSSKRNGGVLQFSIFILFCFLFIEIQNISIFMWVLYTIVFIDTAKNWLLGWLQDDFKDEVYADTFSLYALTENERALLFEKCSTPRYNYASYFANSKMLKSYKDQRIKLFLKNLKLSVDGRIDEMFEHTILSIENSILYLVTKNMFWIVLYFSIGSLYAKSGAIEKTHYILLLLKIGSAGIIGVYFLNLKYEKKLTKFLHMLDH